VINPNLLSKIRQPATAIDRRLSLLKHEETS